MAQPPGTTESPSSSKRSRSRDSARSATPSSSPNTPAASTSNLAAAPSTPGTPANGECALDGTPYPAFLHPVRADVHAKWSRLEWMQMERLRDSAIAHAQGPDQAQVSPWARCSGEAYALRNRYANVDPYQANRVRLAVPDGHSDYINASPIVLETTTSHTPLRYIATQGPKADSWSHLWRMLWNQNTSPCVIVMLTQTVEMGREKCYPYYPQAPTSPQLRTNEHDEFDDGLIHTLHLASLTQDDAARTQVREIDMTPDDGSEAKKIWHLLFDAWPDFSVPEGADRAAMLNLIEMSRDKNSDNTTNPRIVHCSAGIGRSGTFIALDWLLQELDEGALDCPPDHHDPILAVVESLRDQRAGMVQSKSQFLFLYDVLRDRWRQRWTALHPDDAAALGLATPSPTHPHPHIDQPALKRHKSARDDSDTADAVSDAEARARLENELMEADARVGI